MSRQTNLVCLSGSGNHQADLVVVSRMPNSGDWQEELEEQLGEVGFEPRDIWFTAAARCRSFEDNPSNPDLKACRRYLGGEVGLVKPRWILALGNEALFSTTGRSGITKYRGRILTALPDIHGGADGCQVFPTISPAAVRRNPGQRQGYLADLRLLASKVFDRESGIPKPKLWRVDTPTKVKQLAGLSSVSDLVTYDVETTRDHEYAGKIVCLCGTVPEAIQGRDGELHTITWMLPLYHPESPFRKSWRSLLRYLDERWNYRKQVAHNGKFDARWLRYHGLGGARITFDTMLAAHLLDENRQKGLKPQAASRLGVAPWAMDTKDLLGEPLGEVLKYCALDTYYTYHIYLQIREELAAKPRLARIFKLLLMPANEELIQAELRGIWTDMEKVATGKKICADMVTELENQLMKFVPQGEPEELIDMGWPQMGRRGALAKVNFNPSNFSRWFLFDHLELPVLGRGKMKDDGGAGDPSMREGIMMELKEYHEVPKLMLERTTWNKKHQFFTAYEEAADGNDRIHSTFKLYGTVTGRLSSGKDEADKLTGIRNTRGINLQQVPRDPTVRGCFGAAPPYVFVEVDFSQVELRVVAFLSRDPQMLHLYQTGQDIHRATASWVLGVPPDRVSKEDRKKAKAVNFGFVYGMGARKFVSTAFEKYELHFSIDEATAIRKEFFRQFSGLQRWHGRMRQLAHNNARVHSPIGRARNLPDIRSADEGVVAEAERQAINSPVQSFASDMNLLGLIETMRAAREMQLDLHVLGTVHDATLFEVHRDHLVAAMELIKHEFEHLPLKRRFGVDLDVPIVADLKVGTHWGTAVEVPEEVWERKKLGTFRGPTGLKPWLDTLDFLQ